MGEGNGNGRGDRAHTGRERPAGLGSGLTINEGVEERMRGDEEALELSVNLEQDLRCVGAEAAGGSIVSSTGKRG